jgi:hypothetical protein
MKEEDITPEQANTEVKLAIIAREIAEDLYRVFPRSRAHSKWRREDFIEGAVCAVVALAMKEIITLSDLEHIFETA